MRKNWDSEGNDKNTAIGNAAPIAQIHKPLFKNPLSVTFQVHHVHSLTQSEFHVHRHVHQNGPEIGGSTELKASLDKDGGHEMSLVDMKVDMTVDMEPLPNKDGGHGGHGGHDFSHSADFCTSLPNEMKALSINQPWASLIYLKIR